MLREMASHYFPYQPTLSPTGLSRYDLHLCTLPPGPPLRSVVHRYIKIRARKATLYPVIPDGTHALYLTSTGVKLSAGLSRAMIIPIAQAGDYYGVHFYPGALQRLAKVAGLVSRNQLLDADEVPIELAFRLRDIFLRSGSFSQQVDRCDHLLAQHLRAHASPVIDDLLSLVYRARGNIRITEIAKQTGYSTRHINRLFHQVLGLSSKTFVRIVRMQSLLRTALTITIAPDSTTRSSPLERCLATANQADFGFYDQSHFLKEYHLLLGEGVLP